MRLCVGKCAVKVVDLGVLFPCRPLDPLDLDGVVGGGYDRRGRRPPAVPRLRDGLGLRGRLPRRRGRLRWLGRPLGRGRERRLSRLRRRCLQWLGGLVLRLAGDVRHWLLWLGGVVRRLWRRTGVVRHGHGLLAREVGLLLRWHRHVARHGWEVGLRLLRYELRDTLRLLWYELRDTLRVEGPLLQRWQRIVGRLLVLELSQQEGGLGQNRGVVQEQALAKVAA
mmetsp:Transcript_61200/g.178865  ORF Transcript_61200/g.178865 Transcript_61200/m.178865 type:complete len:224 (+) Transcript_61200:1386-2057(+)